MTRTAGAPFSIPNMTARRALVAATRRRHGGVKTFPYRYGDIVVTRSSVHMPYGRSTHASGYLTHLLDGLFIAWRRGEVVEAGARWRCGGLCHNAVMMVEPTSPVCPACTIERVGRP